MTYYCDHCTQELPRKSNHMIFNDVTNIIDVAFRQNIPDASGKVICRFHQDCAPLGHLLKTKHRSEKTTGIYVPPKV